MASSDSGTITTGITAGDVGGIMGSALIDDGVRLRAGHPPGQQRCQILYYAK
jgi:hypothetical protein